MPQLAIRQACEDDAPVILHFITELARYERAVQEVIADEEAIKATLFGPQTTSHAVICEADGRPIGFAVYFYNYSTWLGKNGLYLEDLYINPEYRKNGAGRKLMKHLAGIAVAKGCGRFEWSVLDWNEPAIEFYKSIGAQPLDEWIIYRLTGDALEAFAQS